MLFVRNMPPETDAGFTIDEPSLYFGELSSDYVIVRTKTREFHYPSGDDNVLTQYDGHGRRAARLAVPAKLLFALRFGAYQILLSDDIGPESRILFNRNIASACQAIAPFLDVRSAIRIWCWPTAGCTGCWTPTRRRAVSVLDR